MVFHVVCNEVSSPEYPELEDFGDAQLTGKNGSAGYFRLDWFTPDGLRTWGDGRMFILGTKGFVEVRKYVNLASEKDGGCHVYLVNEQGEKYMNAAGVTGYPFFGELKRFEPAFRILPLLKYSLRPPVRCPTSTSSALHRTDRPHCKIRRK